MKYTIKDFIEGKVIVANDIRINNISVLYEKVQKYLNKDIIISGIYSIFFRFNKETETIEGFILTQKNQSPLITVKELLDNKEDIIVNNNENNILIDTIRKILPIKDIKVFRTSELNILNKYKRNVTVCVFYNKETNKITAGYSVKLPNDNDNIEITRKIAFGRALLDRSNILPETFCGYNMNKRYIIVSIALQLLKDIESGKIVIKGIRDIKESK